MTCLRRVDGWRCRGRDGRRSSRRPLHSGGQAGQERGQRAFRQRRSSQILHLGSPFAGCFLAAQDVVLRDRLPRGVLLERQIGQGTPDGNGVGPVRRSLERGLIRRHGAGQIIQRPPRGADSLPGQVGNLGRGRKVCQVGGLGVAPAPRAPSASRPRGRLQAPGMDRSAPRRSAVPRESPLPRPAHRRADSTAPCGSAPRRLQADSVSYSTVRPTRVGPCCSHR